MVHCFLSAGLSLLFSFGLFVGITQSCYDVVIVGGGLWGKFSTALESHYCGANALKTGSESSAMLEPSEGDSLFKQMVVREPNLTVWCRATASGFERRDDKWSLTVDRNATKNKVLALAMLPKQ